MRDKILGIIGVKWEWHIVLTFNQDSLDEVLKSNPTTGDVLAGFLSRSKNINKTNRKYFWKYEEGRKTGRPHFHLLFEFKRHFNREYVLDKMFPKGWKAGAIDINRLLFKYRRMKMNYEKSDVELLMGMWLRKKWRNGYVFARQIKGLREEHKENLMYYINKDLLKSTGGIGSKIRGHKWKFGQEYKFDIKPLFPFEADVSVNRCVHKMLTTKQNYVKYYDSKKKDGFQLFMNKIRNIKKGKFFKLIY